MVDLAKVGLCAKAACNFVQEKWRVLQLRLSQDQRVPVLPMLTYPGAPSSALCLDTFGPILARGVAGQGPFHLLLSPSYPPLDFLLLDPFDFASLVLLSLVHVFLCFLVWAYRIETLRKDFGRCPFEAGEIAGPPPCLCVRWSRHLRREDISHGGTSYLFLSRHQDMAAYGPEFLDVCFLVDASEGHFHLSGLPSVQILRWSQLGTSELRFEQLYASMAPPACSSTGLRILPVRRVGGKVHE